MSWQAYVDQSMVSTGHLDKGAIFSAAGDSAWAQSAGFTIKPAEVQEIAKAYKNGTTSDLFGTGFHIATEKYITIKADDRSIYGKQGKTGMVIVKTKQAILIAHYPENVQPGQATKTLEDLADYMIGMGY